MIRSYKRSIKIVRIGKNVKYYNETTKTRKAIRRVTITRYDGGEEERKRDV